MELRGVTRLVMHRSLFVLICTLATGCYYVNYEGNHIWRPEKDFKEIENLSIGLFMHTVLPKEEPVYLYLQAYADTRHFKSLQLTNVKVSQGGDSLASASEFALNQFGAIVGVGFKKYWGGISRRVGPVFTPSANSASPVIVELNARLEKSKGEVVELSNKFTFHHSKASGGAWVNILTQ
jgi:hypothetical protein